MLELEVEVVKKWVLRLASGFQKEGSRAGVPIGCQTSAPSRGSKKMRKSGSQASAFSSTFFPEHWL